MIGRALSTVGAGGLYAGTALESRRPTPRTGPARGRPPIALPGTLRRGFGGAQLPTRSWNLHVGRSSASYLFFRTVSSYSPGVFLTATRPLMIIGTCSRSTCLIGWPKRYGPPAARRAWPRATWTSDRCHSTRLQDRASIWTDVHVQNVTPRTAPAARSGPAFAGRCGRRARRSCLVSALRRCGCP